MKKLLWTTLICITSLLALDNSRYVTLTQNGDFSKYSHFGFFIDSDNNSHTGYSNWKIKGADLYLQENGLYRYPQGATEWKWEKIDPNLGVTHTKTSMSGLLSLNFLEADSVNYYAFVSDEKWKKSDVLDRQSLAVNVAQTPSTQNYKNRYIVSPNGDDQALGDEAHPFHTIQKALDVAQAGDLVFVKAGVYYERLVVKHSGKKGAPITIEGERDKDGKRLVTLFGGERVTANWVVADEISPLVYKTQDIPYHPFAMTVQRDGQIKDIPKLYAQKNVALITNREYDYKDVLAYTPERVEEGPYTKLQVNYWDGIEALYAYEPSTHTTYMRFRDGENPNNMTLFSSPGGKTFFGKSFDPSHQGAVVTIANKSHIIVRGFNIDGAQDGVLIYGKEATNNIIEKNEITNGQRRVLLAQNTSNNLIRENKMHMQLLSKKFRPGAWLGQHRHDITDNYSSQEREKIAVAEHYYNVYKHEVGAVTSSLQDDCGINFIYAGDGNQIYKNEIYDTLGGIVGILSSNRKIDIYDNLLHHISSVSTHVPEFDEGEYLIHDNKMYDVQIGTRVQLRLFYDNRQYLAKKVYFYNNTIYNPSYLGVSLYVYRPNSGVNHDYQNESQYHPELKFENNIVIGGRVLLDLHKNLGSKTVLNNNIFSNASIELEKGQSIGSVQNNWIHTILPSTYPFDSTNTISNTPKWELPKIPTDMPQLK